MEVFYKGVPTMNRIAVFPETVFSIGPVQITDTVVYTWVIMVVIIVTCFFLTRRLSLWPTLRQEALEAVFEAIKKTVQDVVPLDPWFVVPLIGTLWILIGFSNIVGLVPGIKTPTADINTTFAFAILSYGATHAVGISHQGLKRYLSHYGEPTWIVLPFHLIAEVTRTLALAVRLFGNMLSGDMVAVIILGIAGLLAPVPFALLHIVIGLIQAYIFGVLTLVFIAGGLSEGR
jgi:F-type H+-transporting ATPase subunit a